MPGGIHGWACQLPGPGSSEPGRSWKLTSRWSIETIPATYEVYTEDGRRKVPKMAGSPLTVSSTRHWPSPGSGVPAGELSRFGMIGWKFLVCRYFTGAVLGTASEKDGLPPTLGGW